MQIISEKYKRRRLFESLSSSCRPSKGIVRESLFNILGESILDSSFLDLYAGTGSVGIEALSRGAKRVVFVEKDLTVLKKNIQNLDDDFQAVSLDVLHYLKRSSETFDIVFMDPPWDMPYLYKSTLNQLLEFDILKEGSSCVVCEHHKNVNVSEILPEMCSSSHSYGNTVITVFK